MKIIYRSFRLSPELGERIDAEAARDGCSASEVMRRAIERYFSEAQLLDDCHRRHLRTTEYMQLAIDTFIRENHPELREPLILEADRRMRVYHGAR